MRVRAATALLLAAGTASQAATRRPPTNSASQAPAATPHASLEVLYVFFSKKCKVAVSVYVRTPLLGQGYRRPTARRRGSNTGQTKNPFLGSQLCATKPGHQETTESDKYHGQHPTASESSTLRSTTLSDERSVDSHLKTFDAEYASGPPQSPGHHSSRWHKASPSSPRTSPPLPGMGPSAPTRLLRPR